ncbi:MAG: 6,7-dimethyl-8-ribityllumazine synthase [Candidatus Altiarchaeota archaeon]|nr:6,7-dimethyl-8-ribityllumazine synthase [Candidatus Altiarchaeota archaeon]
MAINLGFVVSEFNYDISSKMLERAKEHAGFLGVNVVEVVTVSGAFDMPLAVKKLLKRKDVDGVVTLGAIIKGETDHDEVIASQLARKITDLALEYNKPVSLGVSGPNETRAQATSRIDDYPKRAVESAVKLIKKLGK